MGNRHTPCLFRPTRYNPFIAFIIFRNLEGNVMDKLTKEEQQFLDSLDRKLNHVRAAVRGVVKEWHPALFLAGEGGTSKSYTVLDELQKLKAAYIYHNTRMTARGLVDALERNPTE